LFLGDRQTKTEVTKVIVALRNFAKASNKHSKERGAKFAASSRGLSDSDVTWRGSVFMFSFLLYSIFHVYFQLVVLRGLTV
jgi:hypothetical protein